MTRQNSGKGGGKAATEREERLRAALRANLARRKAQARARAASETENPQDADSDQTGTDRQE
ncbi:hypothetical protein CG51_02660 [Haematobacter missouriensis]|uniref:Uncharacterized protein n=1 Tax=Haematobacter missouriensis TaxID=366616 RepID=A0A212ASJ4_9RHOB|nr:hypothetical protein [Haematobacter missouriensis]KFI32263.1 hypothetical protein CG51_02660 [Haematobacter missouriensis]OWJ75295.1 hypothetical protein CDV53_11275 [Haematobacter missouriensis]OWJ84471.1 hypothetical protein CDV52_07210 [Haematobacter missouriensis]